MTRTAAFALRLADLAGSLGERITVARLNSMATALADELTDEEFQLACRMVIVSESRLPAPAKFIEYARGSARATAEDACGKVFLAIRDYGAGESSKARAFLGEPIWKTVERMGGWVNLCTREGFNIGVFRAQFLNCMEQTAREHVREKAMLLLPVGKEVLELTAGLAERKSFKKQVK